MDGVFERIAFDSSASPVAGTVRWSAVKSLWWSGMALGWVILGSLYFSWGAVAVFVMTSAVTLCLGHSLGMHRWLIHGAFETSPALGRVLVWLGTLTGLGGPRTMMFTHDIRDWAQRSTACHPFLSHQSGITRDFWWQLHCKLHLDKEPEFRFPLLLDTPFYRWLQASSMAQQLPVVLLLFAAGGPGWVAWGVCGRVTVSIFGHWLVGWFAHNRGSRDWHLEGASTQGYNLPLGLLTMGESFHNNHHAFPGSARLSLQSGQCDPGWWVLNGLERLGLVWNLREPDALPRRENLRGIA
ncbi:MAG: acyl-CoA desaturase [Rhodobacteraceae bacterium]|nr:acyl-CoA desaturase [Paracoccaceae bacterium]